MASAGWTSGRKGLRFASRLNRRVVYIYHLDGARSGVRQKERMAVSGNTQLARLYFLTYFVTPLSCASAI